MRATERARLRSEFGKPNKDVPLCLASGGRRRRGRRSRTFAQLGSRNRPLRDGGTVRRCVYVYK